MKTRDEIARELYNDCLELIQPPPVLQEVRADLLFISAMFARDYKEDQTPEDREARIVALARNCADTLNHEKEAGPELLAAVAKHAAEYIASWKDPEEIQREGVKELGAIFREGREAPAGTENFISGPIANTIMEFFTIGDDINQLPEHKKNIEHGAEYEIFISKDDRDKRRVTKTTANEALAFEITDIKKFVGTNAPAKNLFMLALIEINKQALYNGVLTRDYISFPLQTLIDAGMYGDQHTARRGFMKGIDALTSVKVSGSITQGKDEKQVLKNGAIEVLFTGGNIKNSICTLYINTRINWAAVAPYFSIIPSYYFRLPNRAQDLLYYIFYLARQNADKIEKEGFFTISFRAIHSRLNLPAVDTAAQPGRDIVGVIEDAIEAIEERNKTFFPDNQFNLLPIYPKPKGKRLSAAEFIEKGKLKVSFSGDLAEAFRKISKQKTKKITETQKKAARIEEKAAAIRKAKATEKEPG